MKKLFFLVSLFSVIALTANSQQLRDTTKVILENEKIKVTEYVSTPGKDVCGKGMHSHPAHLSILLTDALVRVTGADGKSQDFDLKAGTTFWSEAESHMAINSGKKMARAYLVELK